MRFLSSAAAWLDRNPMIDTVLRSVLPIRDLFEAFSSDKEVRANAQKALLTWGVGAAALTAAAVLAPVSPFALGGLGGVMVAGGFLTVAMAGTGQINQRRRDALSEVRGKAAAAEGMKEPCQEMAPTILADGKLQKETMERVSALLDDLKKEQDKPDFVNIARRKIQQWAIVTQSELDEPLLQDMGKQAQSAAAKLIKAGLESTKDDKFLAKTAAAALTKALVGEMVADPRWKEALQKLDPALRSVAAEMIMRELGETILERHVDSGAESARKALPGPDERKGKGKEKGKDRPESDEQA